MDQEREGKLRKIAEEFRAMLARDEDNGGPLLREERFKYYKKLASFKPRYQLIPNKGLINRIRRHFWEVFST